MANKLATALLEPFDDSLFEKNYQGFTYVAAEHYRARLLEVFDIGYTFEVTDAVMHKTGIQASAHFKGTLKDTSYDIKVPIFQPYIVDKEGNLKTPLNQIFSMLTTEGLTKCAREMGLGLHLYMGDAGEAKPKAKTTTQKAAPSSEEPEGETTAKKSSKASGTWDGSAIMQWGTRFKGVAYKDVDQSYLEWAAYKKSNRDTGELDPDQNSIKELKRREGHVAEEATSNVKAASTAKKAAAEPAEEEDVELPF